MMFIGLNDLTRVTGFSRLDLRKWIDAGKIPYAYGKAGKMLFDEQLVMAAIQKIMLEEMNSGTRSLPTHHAGTDGQGSDSVEEKPGV
jgi:hypothetical protein